MGIIECITTISIYVSLFCQENTFSDLAQKECERNLTGCVCSKQKDKGLEDAKIYCEEIVP